MGLGKLGLPMALAVENAGHDVAGYDPSDAVRDIFDSGVLPYREKDAQELLDATLIQLVEPKDLCDWADLVFVAVQTPHKPEFEGTLPLSHRRADFNYDFLTHAVGLARQAKQLAVISTVLPGTLERVCEATRLDPKKILYNPSFIAMGTTIPDFLFPEFVLVGTDGASTRPLREFYASIHSAEVFVTTIRTAELTKVAYNTFIGLKIAFANAMMELCQKTGADVDDLVDALELANRRIISSAYMRGGMGDGGGCHPRDNIALSWLAQQKDLSYDLFTALMEAREEQTDWIANLAVGLSDAHNLPIEILGKAYKPGTNLTVGSPATLLGVLLSDLGVSYDHSDPYVDEKEA